MDFSIVVAVISRELTAVNIEGVGPMITEQGAVIVDADERLSRVEMLLTEMCQHIASALPAVLIQRVDHSLHHLPGCEVCTLLRLPGVRQFLTLDQTYLARLRLQNASNGVSSSGLGRVQCLRLLKSLQQFPRGGCAIRLKLRCSPLKCSLPRAIFALASARCCLRTASSIVLDR